MELMNEYIRYCPRCREKILYSTKYCKKYAEKDKRLCRSCGKSGESNPFYGKKQSKKYKEKMKLLNLGKNNPMYGRHHSLETKILISKSVKEGRQ